MEDGRSSRTRRGGTASAAAAAVSASTSTTIGRDRRAEFRRGGGSSSSRRSGSKGGLLLSPSGSLAGFGIELSDRQRKLLESKRRGGGGGGGGGKSSAAAAANNNSGTANGRSSPKRTPPRQKKGGGGGGGSARAVLGELDHNSPKPSSSRKLASATSGGGGSSSRGGRDPMRSPSGLMPREAAAVAREAVGEAIDEAAAAAAAAAPAVPERGGGGRSRSSGRRPVSRARFGPGGAEERGGGGGSRARSRAGKGGGEKEPPHPQVRGILRQPSYTGLSSGGREEGRKGSPAAAPEGREEEEEEEAPRQRPARRRQQLQEQGQDGQEEEDGGYRRFVEELRREVAGDHTELWGAFQAMLGGEEEGGGGRSLVPPGEDDEEGGGGGRRRLGPEAQAALASVHRHLSSLAEAEDRGTSSQLVKDRQVARERRARARARADPKPKAEPEVELKPQSKPKAAPKPQSKPKVEPKAQPKVEPKAQPKVEPKAQPKEQPKQRVKGGGENSGDLRPNAAIPKGAPPSPPPSPPAPTPPVQKTGAAPSWLALPLVLPATPEERRAAATKKAPLVPGLDAGAPSWLALPATPGEDGKEAEPSRPKPKDSSKAAATTAAATASASAPTSVPARTKAPAPGFQAASSSEGDVKKKPNPMPPWLRTIREIQRKEKAQTRMPPEPTISGGAPKAPSPASKAQPQPPKPKETQAQPPQPSRVEPPAPPRDDLMDLMAVSPAIPPSSSAWLPAGAVEVEAAPLSLDREDDQPSWLELPPTPKEEEKGESKEESKEDGPGITASGPAWKKMLPKSQPDAAAGEAAKPDPMPPWLKKLRGKQRKLRDEQPKTRSFASPDQARKVPNEASLGRRLASAAGKKRPLEELGTTPGLPPSQNLAPWQGQVKLRPTPAKPVSASPAPWQVALRATPAKQAAEGNEGAVDPIPFAIGLNKTGFFEKEGIQETYSSRIAEPEAQWNPSSAVIPKPTEKRPGGQVQVVHLPLQSYLSHQSYLKQRQPYLLGNLDLSKQGQPKLKPPGSPSHCLGITFGDTIDLSDLPVEVFGPIENVTSLDLASVAKDKQTSVVLVGEEVVVKATRVSSDSDKVTIAWAWHRLDIRSLTLSEEATIAELAMKNRARMSLSFNVADDCIRFAQAFYKLKAYVPPAPASLSEKKSESDELSGSGLVEDSGSGLVKDSDSKLKDSMQEARVLTEEEEFILQQFREGVVTSASMASAFSSNQEIGADPRAALLGSLKTRSMKNTSMTPLSEQEEEIASKYRKMLSMGVPPDAVRHAAQRDQVDKKILDSIFASDRHPEPVSASGLTEKEEEVAATYQKMLKVSIPREAVRQKMIRDLIDKKIILAVVGPVSDKPKRSVLGSLSDEEEKIASQYRKMIKISIPRDAVRSKMMRDNIGIKIIEAVLGKGASSRTFKNADDAIVLNTEEEATAAKYRKMIKLSIPTDAVRHKMMKDNVDNRVIIAVVGESQQLTPNGKKKNVKKSKTVSLHWTPLSPSAIEMSVWKHTAKKRRIMDSRIPEEAADVKRLEELFEKKAPTDMSKASGENSNEAGSKKKMAGLIDLNRANMIAISLKAFKDFTHTELSNAIANLDSENKIVGERVHFLTGLIPNQAEVAAVKAYKGTDARLVPAELFFRNLLSVKRVTAKVHVIQTIATFRENVRDTGIKFKLLEKVCKQVMENEKLPRVLEMVLHVGNLMNEGTRTGNIEGFRCDSLLKLTQTKSRDGKSTVLDYIISVFIARKERSILDFASGFPECEKASRIAISDLLGDARGLKTDLNRCKTELAALNLEMSEKRVTRSMSKKKSPDAAPSADNREALFAAIKARGDNSNNKAKDEEPAEPRTALLAAIKAKSEPKVDPDKDKELDSKADQAVSPVVARLESFIKDVAEDLQTLEGEKYGALKACKDMSVYFGEAESEKAAVPLLAVLASFVKGVESALKKHDDMIETERRKKMKADKRREREQAKIEEGKKSNKNNVSQNVTSEKEDVISDSGKTDGKGDTNEALVVTPTKDLTVTARTPAAGSQLDPFQAINSRGASEDGPTSESSIFFPESSMDEGEQDPREALLSVKLH